MKIQTLSIVVPTKKCVNNCKFCVSKTHSNDYENKFNDKDSNEFKYYRQDIKRRLDYAKLHGVDTIILTGTGEVFQNKPFLLMVDDILKDMNNSFPRIEVQTSGVMLSDINLYFLKEMGVSTISLSVSDVFDDKSNMNIIGVHDKLKFNLFDLCKKIKGFGFNLRISLNMTSVLNGVSSPSIFFDRFKELGANQVTFREMYYSSNNTDEDKWIKEHMFDSFMIDDIKTYIKDNGRSLYVLPFGGVVYSIKGISTVIDDDCMDSKSGVDDVLKYLILREDGKLYCQWDDEGSLIF